MGQAHDFLTALWDGMPKGLGIQVWQKVNRKTISFESPTLAANFAERAAKTRDNDIYTAAGLAPTVSKTPQKQRANATDVVGIPGLWADIDVNGGPEGKTGAAADHDTALELASSILEPTLIVNSGYGIQAWWLFEEPWVFHTAEEREQGARLVAAFQAGLKANAKRDGWSIDSTHDLARLMRLPGTLNWKGSAAGQDPVPVEILEDDGPRHSLEHVGEVVQVYMAAATEALHRATGKGINVELRGEATTPPLLKLDELCKINDDFKVVWEHLRTPKTRTWSMSEYEMSIANYIVRAGFSDQEAADTLVYHRLRWGDPKGKASRVDYISQVIGKARQAVEDADEEEELAREREDAVDQLASMSKSGTTDPVRANTLFTKIVGGNEVKELIQDGRDPDTARYRVVLADGREVPIGTANMLLDYGKFRERYMVVTGKLPPRMKPDKWDKVVQAMLDNATVNEDNEDARSARVMMWMDSYIDQGLSTDRNAACQARDAFEDEGEVYVYLDSFSHWLKRIRGERLALADLKQLMLAAGFERRTIAYTNDEDKRTSRSYWVIPKETITA